MHNSTKEDGGVIFAAWLLLIFALLMAIPQAWDGTLCGKQPGAPSMTCIADHTQWRDGVYLVRR